MNGKQLSDLREIFVNFETEKLDKCSVIYINEVLANGKSPSDILSEYSFIVRPEPAVDRNRSVVKNFMAERYGGDGILNNGGGGRCGFDGMWQLKGLGPNQLVGNDVDPRHGDGNLSLETAIYESIWSEIIQAVLPYGAIRTIAILDTGSEFDFGGVMTPRGLLVRQPVVRPAHFIRATYFRQKQLNTLGEDAQRVKAVIGKLVEFLPGASAPASSSLVERLQFGLLELAGRYAEQFAAARAKHIIHYNVSASNLSLDGAWLDLSEARLFTSFINGDRTDVDRFNTEYLPSIQSLQSLCYYLSKYAVISFEQSLHLSETTTAHFIRTYNTQLSLYRAAQTGFPLWLVRRLAHTAEFAALSSCLESLLELDDFTVSALTLGGDWDGYERWTARLYSTLLSSKTSPASPINLAWLNIGVARIGQLLSSYSQFFDLAVQAASEQHIDLRNFTCCMAINVTRLNRSHRVLHNLGEDIERIRGDIQANKESAYQKLMGEAVLAARLNLANEYAAITPFWLSHALSIWFDPRSGLYTLLDTNNRNLSITSLIERGKQEIEVRRALHFYHGIWSNLNEK
ncbi:UNVERIFIED_ORG: hypothetical protein J2Y76_002894 [Pseudomonas reinekei]|uniref:hypothetical protein n=1 Tax=Pseudomonas laurylsulfatiphila TaxID=2011015 RepID=UPI003D262FD6|nr:hypothetical protein [Pseudomonas reinekei]